MTVVKRKAGRERSVPRNSLVPNFSRHGPEKQYRVTSFEF